ncbi:MAG: hypothetical protein M0004_15925 [Actinomycetota bacterium]|nr:hypothetical protein [Actinomycetota bacterium]
MAPPEAPSASQRQVESLGRHVRRDLADALRGERRAYGFTMVVWGTGAILLGSRGSPGIAGVAAYLGGIVVAMAIVLLVDAGGPRAALPTSRGSHPVISAIHLIAPAGGTAAGVACGLAVPGVVGCYFVAGLVACLVFQVGLAIELVLGDRMSD